MPDELYAELEHDIYEAAVVPERWPQLMERLADISHCAGGLLMCANERGTHWVSTEEFRTATERFFNEG